MGSKISVKASPKTLTVDDDGQAEFNTIQEAINNATSGDTIFVKAGTYYEQVVVNKTVSLIGEDRDSTIVDGGGTGSVISMITASKVSIRGFTLRNSGIDPNDSGIYVYGSSGNDISHNTIINNFYGISCFSSTGGNVVSDNTISSNNFYGVYLYSSHNHVFSSNIIMDNSDGISIVNSNDNVVSDNTISSNTLCGVYLYSSLNNVVSSNIITNNRYGMQLFYSSNNVIYRNNFNNTNQAESDSTNVWDNGVEGNYWSDYAGQDLNGEGIGDTPYLIDANNRDNRPLMGMFSDFNVTLKRETYHVTTICNSTISNFKFKIGPETGNKIIRFNATGKDGTVGFCRVTIPTELMNHPYIVLVGEEEIVPTSLDVSNETYVCLYFTYLHSSHTITIISSKTLHLYNELLKVLYNLNATYYDLLNNYSVLLDNYSQLQESYRELNNSYWEHLTDYFKNVHNIRSLMYIFAATTAIFIITTIYLSKRAHAGKTKLFEDKQRAREAI